MSNPTDSIQEQLAALRRAFADQLPQRMAVIDAAHADWCSGNSDKLSEYHRLVHSLTGAGATFGFDRISVLARQLERHLKHLAENGNSASADQLEEAGRLLNEVRTEALAATAPEPPEVPQEPEAAPPAPSNHAYHTAYLLSDEENSASEISRQLQHFGYHVESFANGDQLQQTVAARPPAILLAEIALPEGDRAGIDAIAMIQRQQTKAIPTIFFATHADFDTRLAAVRAWGLAYLPKPISIEKLVDLMDGMVAREQSEPYRVLVVDDQPDQAQHNALVLRKAGILTEVVTDSMKVFDTLAEFGPELILMDMYMPRCNGLELAAVIRQRPEYVGVPIVFLSSETDRTLQLDAMRIGGDDFLTKPIKPGELIEAVTIRADRYRTLRSLMSRDSLTGLLNHTHIMESLEHEVSRAERYGASLSFAMIDIDHFKRVNDTYGHAAGDGVIKSLARLLQQRLRKTDVIGRYGGEEFAVIMPETPLTNAVKVMDDVRRHFSEVVHQAGDESFSVTLSCGVASVPPLIRVNELHEQADKRLYRAKQGGRNRVCNSDN